MKVISFIKIFRSDCFEQYSFRYCAHRITFANCIYLADLVFV